MTYEGKCIDEEELAGERERAKALDRAVGAMIEQLNQYTYGEGGQIPETPEELVEDLEIAAEAIEDPEEFGPEKQAIREAHPAELLAAAKARFGDWRESVATWIS